MAHQVTSLLEKMSSTDKDYRFMAITDLITELHSDSIKLDDEAEWKLVRMLIKLLEDKSGEVQNLTVKCMGLLIQKIKISGAEIITDTLCSNISSGNEKLRDVSSIALKTVISELSVLNGTMIVNIVKRVVPRLADTLRKKEIDVPVQLEVIDIISDILIHYGSSLSSLHGMLRDVLMELLVSERQALRKRAIIALGNLTAVSDRNLFGLTIDAVTQGLSQQDASISHRRTMVQVAQCVCKSNGRRFVKYLPQMVPILVQYAVSTDDDELRESCLQAFETFIYRCPREIAPYASDITNIVVLYLKHDPNYTYDDENEEMDNVSQMDFGGGDTEDEDEESTEYSDDDDMSWKVRRASAKCIEALILSRREGIAELINTFGPLLISRFKEREENVKWDIFHAYTALLSQTRNLISNCTSTNVSQNGKVVQDLYSSMHREKKENNSKQGALSTEQLEAIQALDAQIPSLVRAVSKQLCVKIFRTKQCCFILLTELLHAYPGALRNELNSLMAGVASSMNDKSPNTNMKIDTLGFLSAIFCMHEPEILHSHMVVLAPLVIHAVGESFYKVSAEALSVIISLIRVLRSSSNEQFDFLPYVNCIYDAVFEKLKATDIDQEVKEKAITATGVLISTFGDVLNEKLPACLPIFLERLRNEMTRLVTVRALNVIVNSSLKISIDIILSETLLLLAEFLRKNQRALRMSTLHLLDSLVTNYQQGSVEGSCMAKVFNETPALISEFDLQISQLALIFLTHSISMYATLLTADLLPELLSSFIKLLESSLLQGSTLTAALNFMSVFVQTKIPNKPSFEELLDRLTAPVFDNPSLHRQVYRSVSACTATVALASGCPKGRRSLATKLSDQIDSNATSEGVRLFSLLALGELACKCPETFENFLPRPEELIGNAFNSSSEEMKTAASYALGRLAIGNLSKFLPFLLDQINLKPKRQYLLLHALKEVIRSESGDQDAINIFSPHIEKIWPVLMTHATVAEEGTRNVVAECLGKLCFMQPELLQRLKECVDSTDAFMRATAVTAVKFMIVEQWSPVDELLQPMIYDFLRTVADEDLNVRRVALVTFNSAAHNKPSLIRGLLNELLPSLYAETIIKKELVHEVEMGPFKHTVDDGLDLRKAAFECMYTLLETCLERIDVFEFITYLENGLRDQHDIKLLTYLMITRLAILCPSQILQRVDALCEPLKVQIQAKPKVNAVKQESDKQEELRRSALRVVVALQRISEADRQQCFADLLAVIRSSNEINAVFQAIERDTAYRSFAPETTAMEVE